MKDLKLWHFSSSIIFSTSVINFLLSDSCSFLKEKEFIMLSIAFETGKWNCIVSLTVFSLILKYFELSGMCFFTSSSSFVTKRTLTLSCSTKLLTYPSNSTTSILVLSTSSKTINLLVKSMDSYSAFKSFSFVFKSIPKKLVTPLTIVFATILAPHNTGLFLLRNGTFDSKKCLY